MSDIDNQIVRLTAQRLGSKLPGAKIVIHGTTIKIHCPGGMHVMVVRYSAQGGVWYYSIEFAMAVECDYEEERALDRRAYILWDVDGTGPHFYTDEPDKAVAAIVKLYNTVKEIWEDELKDFKGDLADRLGELGESVKTLLESFSITGLSPSNETGDGFSCSNWTWRPLLNLIVQVNSGDSLGFDLSGWGWNDGFGLKTQEDCDKLANALERAIHISSEPTQDPGDDVEKMRDDVEDFLMQPPKVWSMPRPAGINDEDWERVGSHYSIETDTIQDFISFLRGCGGFSIN